MLTMILLLSLVVWLGFKFIGLALKVTWGVLKIVAVICFAIGFPLIFVIGLLNLVSGVWIPILLLVLAFGLIRKAATA